MDSERALATLTDAHRLGRAQVGILALDFGAFSEAGGAPGTRLMLSDLADKARVDGESVAAAAPRDLKAEVAAAPASRRRAIVAARVREQALRTLGLAADFPLDSRQGLRDVGLDSLMAVELRNALQQMAGQPLPSTLLFDFPTVEALSAHLLQAVGGDRPQPREVVAVAASPESAMSEDEAEALLREELARSAPPRSGA
jgi:acyl carrier protein